MVIMIGRNRCRQPSKIACSARFSFVALCLEREIDHHDGVLLHDADQKNDSDERIQVEIFAEGEQRQQGAQARRGRPERIVIGWMKLSYRIPSTR